jgi:hypothetical protein
MAAGLKPEFLTEGPPKVTKAFGSTVCGEVVSDN